MSNNISIVVTIQNRSKVCYNLNEIKNFTQQEKNNILNHSSIINTQETINLGYGGVEADNIILNDCVLVFENFVKYISKQIKYFDGDVQLVVVDWGSEDGSVEQTIKDYWCYEYKFIQLGNETFSRGYGLNKGIQNAKYNNLHITDVDLEYHSPRFLEECSELTDGVIFPTIYKETSPSGLYHYLEIAGTGICSITKDLFSKTEGYPDIRKWGGEDIDLFNQLVEIIEPSKIKRTIYPEVIHKWHSEMLGKYK